MPKWIIGLVLGLVLVEVGIVAWVYVVWFYPMDRYYRVHQATYEKTSTERLQLLARQVVKMAEAIGPSNGVLYYIRDDDMPSELRDLDPSWVSIGKDEAWVELHGGGDHFGFAVRRIEGETNVWKIVRYDEYHEIEIGEYSEVRAATNSVAPTPNR